MLTLSQQIVINEFVKELVQMIKTVIKTKPVTRVALRSNKGKQTKRTFSAPVNASGDLANSITYKITDTSIKIYGNDYVYYLVHGRKPTSGGGNGTLKDQIKQWMSDKGIKPEGDMSTDTLAFLITRKIHRHGSSIYLAGKKNSGLLDNILTEQIVKKYNAKFTQQLEQELKNKWLQL
jgi:hypothetical protein